jgi:hypothetical protein
MITFDRQRIEYGEEITPIKIDGFVIIYATPDKGKIASYLMQAAKNISQSEEGEVTHSWQMLTSLASATKTFDDKVFEGKDILKELHTIYMSELQANNPKVEFTSTI